MTDSDNSNLFPVSNAPKMNKSKNKNKIKMLKGKNTLKQKKSKTSKF